MSLMLRLNCFSPLVPLDYIDSPAEFFELGVAPPVVSEHNSAVLIKEARGGILSMLLDTLDTLDIIVVNADGIVSGTHLAHTI